MNSNNNLNSLIQAGTTEQQSFGIKLTTRPLTAESTRVGYTNDHSGSDKTIQEDGWTLSNMLERFSFKNSYDWLSSKTSHSILAKLRIPQDLIVNNLTSAPFSSFMYWRGDVELQFQVTATPFHQGMAVAFFVPLTTGNTIETNIINNFTAISVNQAVYLFANANTAAKMTIPFNSLQHYIDLSVIGPSTPENSLGYVYIVVFNQLALSANASDTATISVFSRFLNNQFKVPRQPNLQVSPPILIGKPQSSAKPSKSQAKHTILGTIANSILPDVTVADTIDLASNLISTMLDKPTDPSLQNPSTILSNSRLNFHSGIENIDKMTMDPSQIFISNSETFSTVEDEMSYEYLKKKYSYLGSFNMTTSQRPGTVLASFPINPFPSLLKAGVMTQIPLLSYISIPFNYYTGGFTYKMQVVSTSLQTGKLFIAFNYGSYSVPTNTDINKVTSQYGQAFEINQGSNVLEFSVPYVATTPYKRVPTSNLPTSQDSLGYINIIVLNSLVAPNNTPTSITFNLFIAGADDFSLNTLSDGNNLTSAFYLATPGLLSKESHDDFELIGTPQASTAPLLSTISEVDEATEHLVAPNSSTVPRPNITNRSILSIRDLFKKYQPVPNGYLTLKKLSDGSSVYYINIQNLLGGSDLSAGILPPQNTLVWPGVWPLLTPLFRSFKGSLRFKIFRNPDNLNFSPMSIIYEAPISNQVPSYGQFTTKIDSFSRKFSLYNGCPLTFNGSNDKNKFRHLTRLPILYANGIQRTIEFETPFSTLYNSLLVPMSYLSENFLLSSPMFDYGGIYVVVDSPVSGNENNQLYVAFGDESRLGNLYNVPSVIVNAMVDNSGATVSSAYPDNYPVNSPNTNTLFRL